MKFKASISIIALVTVSILLIITIGIVNLMYFSIILSGRDLEITRGRWFIEGRINEFFDNIVTGKTVLKPDKFSRKELIDGKEIEYFYEITQNINGYNLHVYTKWKNRYYIEQYVDFQKLDLFNYALFFNSDFDYSLKRNMIVYGNIGINGNVNFSATSGQNFYIHKSENFNPLIEYSQNIPNLPISFFKNSKLEILNSINSPLIIKESSFSLNLLYKKNTTFEELKIPTFDKIWNSYSSLFDPAWVITSSTFYSTKNIINYLTSEKKLIAFGNGFSTKFNYNNENIKNIYIMRTTNESLYQNINNRDYLYYFGFDDIKKYYSIDKNNIYLNASSKPIMLNPTEESFKEYGKYYLSGKWVNYISRDENIDEIYFEKISPNTKLLKGVEFEYNPKEKCIYIYSRNFYKKYSFLIGYGDGYNVRFPFRSMGRVMYVYINNKRTTSYYIERNSIVFNSPPENNSEIRVIFDPPSIFIKKSPPTEYDGIFIDKSEEVVILDLDNIQNYPKNNVIASYLPLLIKGNASIPLVILSKENIYLENINTSQNSSPVLIVSEKGIWIYRQIGQINNIINKCIIYSPLNGIYTVLESGELINPDITIHGTCIFTFEKRNNIMNIEGIFEKNFVFYDDIKKYIYQAPFSYFPSPIALLSIKRY